MLICTQGEKRQKRHLLTIQKFTSHPFLSIQLRGRLDSKMKVKNPPFIARIRNP